MRESIFNLLGHDLDGMRVLDLFAGTGALGIEALSRGAGFAVFVDAAPESIALIGRNLRACGFERSGALVKGDLRKGLPRNHILFREPWDLVFMDPPYGKGLIQPLLDVLAKSAILADGSRLVVESARLDEPAEGTVCLRLLDRRTYGDTRITIYGKEVKN